MNPLESGEESLWKWCFFFRHFPKKSPMDVVNHHKSPMYGSVSHGFPMIFHCAQSPHLQLFTGLCDGRVVLAAGTAGSEWHLQRTVQRAIETHENWPETQTLKLDHLFVFDVFWDVWRFLGAQCGPFFFRNTLMSWSGWTLISSGVFGQLPSCRLIGWLDLVGLWMVKNDDNYHEIMIMRWWCRYCLRGNETGRHWIDRKR